ncbi:MAG: hypothetical protein DRH24_18335 [Deltaproteobacteria bacterium]|nr:MAG: hypothetical protein DRH24_18335 [Deltaproteobacteria bacterium]
MEEFSRLFDALTPGENVLVLYDSEHPPYLLFLALINYAIKKETPVIIDDIIDSLHIYRTNIKLLGLDVSPLDNIPVLKIGGSMNTGHVVARLSLDEDVDIYISRYSSVFGSLIGGEQVPLNIVLGIDKLFAFYFNDWRAIRRLTTIPGEFAEGGHRTAVYFANQRILETFPRLSAMFKDFFTTILVMGGNLKGCRVNVVRSPKIEMMGEEVTLTRA